MLFGRSAQIAYFIIFSFIYMLCVSNASETQSALPDVPNARETGRTEMREGRLLFMRTFMKVNQCVQ